MVRDISSREEKSELRMSMVIEASKEEDDRIMELEDEVTCAAGPYLDVLVILNCFPYCVQHCLIPANGVLNMMYFKLFQVIYVLSIMPSSTR